MIDIAIGGSGWPTSNALPTDVPASPGFNEPGLTWGFLNTPAFSAVIDSVTQVPSLTISPPTSSFIAQQNFDAVVLLSAPLTVASMQASIAGTPIPLSYPGTCQLASPNAAGRPAVICPNAALVLATLGGGPQKVDWQVGLTDGTTLQQSVIWDLVL